MTAKMHSEEKPFTSWTDTQAIWQSWFDAARPSFATWQHVAQDQLAQGERLVGSAIASQRDAAKQWVQQANSIPQMPEALKGWTTQVDTAIDVVATAQSRWCEMWFNAAKHMSASMSQDK